MSVITSGNHPKGKWEGVKAHFGQQYEQHPQEWQGVYTTESSSKSREEKVELPGFGLAQVKPQGGGVSYDSHSEGWTKTFTHVVYGLGYIVTREELEDNLYDAVSKSRSTSLARSMATTKNIVAANKFNRAFNSSYTGGDGVEMIATNHPTLDGVQSNELSTAANFSQAAYEDMLIQISKATDTRGLKMALKARGLLYPVDIQFQVDRVLMSSHETESANNDINPVSNLNVSKHMNHYLTSTTAWFVLTDCPHGLTHFQRRALEFTKDNDFDTENAKAKATERYSFDHADWRGIYGTPGLGS